MTLTVFHGGTVVLCEKPVPFAGFTPPPGARGTEFRLPVHRLRNGPAQGRAILLAAETWLQEFSARSPEKESGARSALAVLSEAGYPLPGRDDSDANVVALWRQTPEIKEGATSWLALVQCRCHRVAEHVASRMGVLVEFQSKPTFEQLRELADSGREQFRLEFFGPRVTTVYAL